MLYELIYRSNAKSDTSESDIQNILHTARAFNKANGITGCLLFHNNQFLQLLEGEFNLLMKLYERIKTDTRHDGLVLLHMRETAYRVYPNWTMAYQSMEPTDVKAKVGITEFTEFEPEEESALSKQLFKAVSNNMMTG
ncbi:BLUF domain-containing protein [Roseivirga sp. E12]|uniref:BLUF domain-containing protein n=1 Tax=Roseivirga sp. E12 TaxID=2819237 RepID=UPI001ABD3144|nr:BLUF domain-containing protein [Roseivirga sp. E12]MBO3698652.1 BLUF domain-containing protein [Roseivirga sp. E12]